MAVQMFPKVCIEEIRLAMFCLWLSCIHLPLEDDGLEISSALLRKLKRVHTYNLPGILKYNSLLKGFVVT